MTESLQEIERLVDEYGIARAQQGGHVQYAALMSAISRVLTERDARIAVLEKALKASPCTIDGFDRLVWDCKERDCLRCAALATEKPHE